MSTWVSKGNWTRGKGSVSKQLQDKANRHAPRTRSGVRLGKGLVKRAGGLAVAKRKRPKGPQQRGQS